MKAVIPIPFLCTHAERAREVHSTEKKECVRERGTPRHLLLRSTSFETLHYIHVKNNEKYVQCTLVQYVAK